VSRQYNSCAIYETSQQPLRKARRGSESACSYGQARLPDPHVAAQDTSGILAHDSRKVADRGVASMGCMRGVLGVGANIFLNTADVMTSPSNGPAVWQITSPSTGVAAAEGNITSARGSR
jgi:hypothetical protein